MNSSVTRRVGPAETLLLRPALLLAAAALTGVLTGIRQTGYIFLTAAFLAIISFSFILGIFLYYEGHIKAYLCVLLMIPVFFILGYIRSSICSVGTNDGPEIAYKTDAVVTGRVSDISYREKNIAVTLKNATVYIGDVCPVHYPAEKILVYISYRAMGLGDTDGFALAPYMKSISRECFVNKSISVSGRIYPFEKPSNEGQFDSEAYYRNRGYAASMSADTYVSIDSGPRLSGVNIRIKTFLIRGTLGVLPSGSSGMAAGLLTGDKGLLDGELKTLFSDSGIGHIMSISGLHISVILMGIYGIILKLTKRLRFSISATVLFSFFYLFFTGSTVSAERAVIMLTITLIGRAFFLCNDGLSELGITAAVIVLTDPGYLSDISFILSFSAVLGLFIATEMARAIDIKRKWVRNAFICCFTQIFLSPVLLIWYGEAAVFSILLNILLVPYCSVILISGLFSAVMYSAGAELGMAAAGRVLMFTGRCSAGPAYYMIEVYRRVCSFFSKASYGTLITGTPNRVAVICFYLIILVCTTVVVRYKQLKPLLALIAGAVLTFSFRDPKLYIGFIDVGQGKSIYVESGNGCCLIDGGSSDVEDVFSYRIEPFLKMRGVAKLNDVFVTHFDEDHVNGIEAMIEYGYPLYDRLICSELQTDDIGEYDMVTVRKGDVLGMPDGITVYVLGPDETMREGDSNGMSLVMLFRMDEVTLLITGDSTAFNESLYSDELYNLLDGYSLTVLDVAHHGSRYSNSEALLMSTQPQIAVASAGRDNVYGHPHDDVRERLELVKCMLYSTAEDGRVGISYYGSNEIFVDCYLK